VPYLHRSPAVFATLTTTEGTRYASHMWSAFSPRKGFRYRQISSTSTIPASAPRLLNQNQDGTKPAIPLPALTRHLRLGSGTHSLFHPKLSLETSPNTFDLEQAFSPPVCCYRGEKKGVVHKGCTGGERGPYLVLPDGGETQTFRVTLGVPTRCSF